MKESTYKTLINQVQIDARGHEDNAKVSIHYYDPNIQLSYPRYIEFNLKPRPKQLRIMESIIDYYRIHKKCVVFIYGEVGSGKTMISYLLTRALKSYIYLNNNMLDLGGQPSLDHNYLKMSKSYDSPAIFSIDEIDTIITNNTDANLPHQQHFMFNPNQSTNMTKSKWNSIFDNYGMGYYYNSIVIMTSNKDSSYFDNIDPCYLREGRVNLQFELNKEE
jgi:hypothetical protein